MKLLLLSIVLMMHPKETLIFQFNSDSDLDSWYILDDVVMGGRSAGQFGLCEEGHGLFQGEVSLENNGGFSSVRHSFERKEVESYEKVVLRLRGDGKNYQFRVKTDRNDMASYIASFETTGEWQTVEIAFSDMYPSFRGRRLNRPNYPGDYMEELSFLISNKVAESFTLEIDRISLR